MGEQVWIVQTQGSINWRLQRAGRGETVVGAFPGNVLLDPFGLGAYGMRTPGLSRLRKIGGSEFLVTTTGFALKGAQSPDTPPVEAVSFLLRWMRFVSMQYTMPRNPYAYQPVSLRPLETMNLLDHAKVDDLVGSFVQSQTVPTAVTSMHLTEVGTRSVDAEPPIHSEVMLDSLEAIVQKDFRKAILYAAIAIEALANGELERADTNLVASAPSNQHRVIRLPAAGGGVDIKDPVADILAGRVNFASLLHERPLYSLGRSLLVENQDLYRRARMLYATRNKIAHTGSAPQDEKFLPISEAGAISAIETAISVLVWFGDSRNYVVPSGLAKVADGGT